MSEHLRFVVSRISSNIVTNSALLVSEPWISEKNPRYPIDVEIALEFLSNVERIEIVSNNQYSLRCLELLIKRNEGIVSVGQVFFKQKRKEKHELKRIHIDDVFSKFIFRIHEGQKNPNNQVGILDVEIFGRIVPNSNQNSDFRKAFSYSSKDSDAATEDGKYTKELQELRRVLNTNKDRCVAEENYQLAKQAQIGERLLEKSIRDMRELEKEKTDAVAEEDYEKAADINGEMQRLRSHVLASIDARLTEIIPGDPYPKEPEPRPSHLFSELEESPERPKIVTPSSLPRVEIPIRPRSKVESRPASKQTDDSRSVSRQSLDKTQIKPRPKSVQSVSSELSSGSKSSKNREVLKDPVNKFLERENMVVPAMSQKKRISFHSDVKDFDQSNISQDLHSSTRETSIAHGRDEIKSATKILGDDTINKINSKHYGTRKEGIVEVKSVMKMATTKNAKSIFEAVVPVLGKALGDSVYSAALDLFRTVALEFMPRYQLQKLSQVLADASAGPLLAKLGNKNDKRISPVTQDALIEITEADKKLCKAFLRHILNTQETNNRSEVAVTIIVKKAIDLYDVPNSSAGLTEEYLRHHATQCLFSTNSEVRLHGRSLILKLYEKGDRSTIRRELPMDSDRGSFVREITYQMDLLDRKS